MSQPSVPPKEPDLIALPLSESVDLVDYVVSDVRARILAGKLRSGEVLTSEQALAREFAVSRTVMREAMRSLRAQGLVEVSQGRRPRVAPLNVSTTVDSLDAMLRRGGGSVLDLLEVRRPIEAEIAWFAADRAEPGHVAQLAEYLKKLEDANSLDASIEADVEFHRVLATSTGNDLFVLLLDALSGPLKASRRQTLSTSGAKEALKGHKAIFDAVRQRDADLARRAMLDHLAMVARDAG
jgi:GntR family transcriptional repressor for pyruvate dehydrogenase complex